VLTFVVAAGISSKTSWEYLERSQHPRLLREGSAYFFDADVLELRLLNEAKHCGVLSGSKSQIKKLYQTVNK
jgi:hypothetical protein